MFAVLKRNPLALGLAVLLHIALAVFLILEIDWRQDVKPIGADVEVVQARLVKDPAIEQAAQQQLAEQARQAEREERRLEQAQKQAELEKQIQQREQEAVERRQAEEKKRAVIERKQEQEKQRLAELEDKRRLEDQKRKEQELARKKADQEAKRKVEQERKERVAREKAEAKRKAEQERKERIAREKAEAERKRKAAEAKATAAREAELAAQFAAEQDANELSQISGLIKAKVERNWLRPPGSQGRKCTVNVRLGASGSVLSVNVVESSGNGAFDRSVEAAVYKADPLPMPRSARLLKQFRGGVTFIFDPSN